jgi:hypothetical protein
MDRSIASLRWIERPGPCATGDGTSSQAAEQDKEHE